MEKEQVLVAMSGGVDSSVAAALLLDRGYRVLGVTMRLWSPPAQEAVRGCCSLDDVNDARRVADQLGIPHYTLNMKEEFKRHVVDYFINEYLAGRTPNPCIACNRVLKFDLLLKKARQLGCAKLATGHYARIVEKGGAKALARGLDPEKDQSYFLFDIPQEALERTLFPVGELAKDETRAIAERKGLRVAQKPDSQEICFVPEDNYQKFIAEHAPPIAAGEFVDRQGKKLGAHKGIPFYTVGQRRGLGVAAGERIYVVNIDAASNTIRLGGEEELLAREVLLENLTLRRPLADGARVAVQVRYRRTPAEGSIRLVSGGAVVRFDEPERAVAPGQAAVFYAGDVVAGGGWIARFGADGAFDALGGIGGKG